VTVFFCASNALRSIFNGGGEAAAATAGLKPKPDEMPTMSMPARRQRNRLDSGPCGADFMAIFMFIDESLRVFGEDFTRRRPAPPRAPR